MLHTLAMALLAAPNPAPAPPPGTEAIGSNIIAWFKWVAIIAGVLGLITCGIMMMIGRRNRSSMAADGASGIPWVLSGLFTTVLAAGIVTSILG